MQDELARDHGALTAVMRDFARMLDHGGPDAMADLTRKRIAFSQLFRDHLGREDAMVVGLRRGPVAARALAPVQEHRRAMTALFLRYSDHLKQWTSGAIVHDWQGYRHATLRLQEALYERMRWEERHLHPLIQANGRGIA